MNVQTYLFFDGRCDEALELYQRVLGARVEMLMRFDEAPDPPPPDCMAPGWQKKVMHSSFRIGDTTIMASDGNGRELAPFAAFALSVEMPDAAEADRVFAALADGGAVRMPLGKTFWSPRFGMVADRFGVVWMVSVAE
jgi:PhnB protein